MDVDELRTKRAPANGFLSSNPARWLRWLLDSTSDAVIRQSSDGVIREWNNGAEEVYGYSAAEAIGQPISMLLPGAFRTVTTAPPECPTRCETIRRCKDGRTIMASVCSTPLRDARGRPDGTLSIEQDVNACRFRTADLQNALELAEAASRTKSEFVANISHELRTPMNAILGMIELVRRSPQLPPVLRDYLGTAHDAAQAMLALVNDLLDFSRLEVGKLRLVPQPFSLRDMLDEAMRVLALRARANQLELTCQIDPAVPDDLIGDARRLRQVVLNLVGNAIKFTPAGEVVLRATVESPNEHNLRLRISVRDTGVGVPPELRERIFDPFIQVDAEQSRAAPGSGLGLTISRKITALMGGRIWCESHEPRGTTFHCLVDLEVRKASSGLPAPTVEQIRGRSVLVVEDHAATRNVLTELVSAWGMSPHVVADPADALRLLQGEAEAPPCDVVLLDAEARGSGGRPLVTQLRRPDWPGKLVLIVPPGELEAAGAEDWLSAGAAAVIEKPISQSDLLEAIVRSLGESTSIGATTWIAPIAPVHKSLRLLVAEDVPANQKVAKSILEQRGHIVDIAEDGQQAVSRARRRRYDAILMDLRMPRLNGLEATDRIRRLSDRRLSEVPIIALTAHALDDDRQRCLNSGMDAFVTKPINADELIRTVERVAAGVRTAETEQRHSAPMETESASQAPLVNLEQALSRIGGDRGLLCEMAGFFREDVPVLMTLLRKSLENGDEESAARAAHSIKGLAANFDALALRDTAACIEELIRAGRQVAARELLDRLQSQSIEVFDALQKELV